MLEEKALKRLVIELLYLEHTADVVQDTYGVPLQFTMQHYRYANEIACYACAMGVADINEIDYGDHDIDEYHWLFDAAWTEHDNTAMGAAFRIIYFLRHGLPSTCDPRDWNSSEYVEFKANNWHIIEEFLHEQRTEPA